MDAATRARIASELSDAYRDGPIDPITSTYPDFSVEDSYEVQLLQIRAKCAAGRVIKGHKVGLTAAQVQKQLGVNEPDYGHLLDDMFYPEHSPIDVSTFWQPKVEPEIAFVLKKSLKGPGVTVSEALSAVEYVVPAIEIVDSRIKDWKITLADTIADNASSGAVVLGGTPTPVDQVDLRLTGCVMTKNSQVIATGAGGAVLGSPINSLVWLANTVGKLGVTLEAGHVVLPGSFTPMAPVAAGETVTATYADLGSVTARFVGPKNQEK